MFKHFQALPLTYSFSISSRWCTLTQILVRAHPCPGARSSSPPCTLIQPPLYTHPAPLAHSFSPGAFPDLGLEQFLAIPQRRGISSLPPSRAISDSNWVSGPPCPFPHDRCVLLCTALLGFSWRYRPTPPHPKLQPHCARGQLGCLQQKGGAGPAGSSAMPGEGALCAEAG